MSDRPSASELLDIARRALLDHVLPEVPAERRLEARIIANVMAIAGREARDGDRMARAALGRLAALHDETPPVTQDAEAVAAARGQFDLRLAGDIRSGVLERDPARLERVRSHLVATTRDALKINNPRYLAAEDDDPSPAPDTGADQRN